MPQKRIYQVPISVVMPVYNADRYIESAIRSILNQTLKDFEFIIINDCSNDNSLRVINKYLSIDKRIKLIQNKINMGICKTLNIGIETARGKYIARMDADDWSYPYRLEKQFEFMEKNIEVGVSGGTMVIIDQNNKIIGKREYALDDKNIRSKIFRYSPFSHPSIMIRKEILRRSGLYDSKFEHAEDYDLYFRIGKYSKFANLNLPLIKYRSIEGSITKIRTKDMELKTLLIRRTYANSGFYNMNIIDWVFNVLQIFSVYLIPSKVKIKLFNYFRNSK